MLARSFLPSQLSSVKLILGSQSPRRKELLQAAGFSFSTRSADNNEDFPEGMAPEGVAQYLSQQKAEAIKETLLPENILITADTIVVMDNSILNKASGPDEAFEMLSLLNGKCHKVITGVSLTSLKSQISFHEITKVCFYMMQPDEIWHYIDQYKPFDKAGAYGIQEWIGLMGVEKIEGCYYNVVGLPVGRLYQKLKSFVLDAEMR